MGFFWWIAWCEIVALITNLLLWRRDAVLVGEMRLNLELAVALQRAKEGRYEEAEAAASRWRSRMPHVQDHLVWRAVDEETAKFRRWFGG
jgi:hypothetical protein